MEDRDFYARRLREELARAANMTDPQLRRLHEGWADLYRERLGRLPREPIA